MTAPCLWQIVCKVCKECMCKGGASLFPFFGAVVVEARPTPASVLHSCPPTAQSTSATSLLYLSCNVQSAHKCYFPHAPPLSLRLIILLLYLCPPAAPWGADIKGGRGWKRISVCQQQPGVAAIPWSNCVLLSRYERERQTR